MKTLTVHVRADHTATLTCPACGAIKHFSAAPYRRAQHMMTVRCHCKAAFPVLLNFRRNFRKLTNLPGTYQVINTDDGSSGIIQVNDLSRGGASFTVSGLHSIEKGQEIQIEFQLDDKKKTVLKKQAVVRSVRQNIIGCQFKCNADLDKDLGFFLQS
ncbi:MAG: PilZ domain-containing protein [Desulfobulbus sp.]|nr:PilZ domain-containing protein [Desulfobulbus sp.]